MRTGVAIQTSNYVRDNVLGNIVMIKTLVKEKQKSPKITVIFMRYYGSIYK